MPSATRRRAIELLRVCKQPVCTRFPSQKLKFLGKWSMSAERCLSSSMGHIYEDPHRVGCTVVGGESGEAHARWFTVGGGSEEDCMLLRQLSTEEERDQSSGDRLWCGRAGLLRGTHLINHCPEFYLRAVQSFHGLLWQLVE